MKPLIDFQISFIVVNRPEYVGYNHTDNQEEYYLLEMLNAFEIVHFFNYVIILIYIIKEYDKSFGEPLHPDNY